MFAHSMMANRTLKLLWPMAGSYVVSVKRREKEIRRSDILEKLRKSYSWLNS